MFFTQQTCSIFILLAVTWGRNLDPCGKSVILTGAIKHHIKIVYIFYPAGVFHLRSFGCHLVSHLGSLWQKCDPGRRRPALHPPFTVGGVGSTPSRHSCQCIDLCENLDLLGGGGGSASAPPPI